MNSRVNIHDSYMSLYSFWWTNTTYLSIFLWLILAGSYLIFMSRSSHNTVFKLSLVLLLSIEPADFTFLNKGWSQSNYICEGLNILLLNSLNHYHPFILYSSFVIATVTLFTHSDREFRHKLYTYTLYRNTYQTIGRTSLTTSVLALSLGSWWAVQEGTWGGWWNWDTSEVLGWLVSLYILVTLHSISRNKFILVAFYKNCGLWGSIVFIYLLVQISFELTAHNFGVKFFYFFNSNLFLLESLSYVFILLVYILNVLLSYNNSIWISKRTWQQRKQKQFRFQAFLRLVLVSLLSAMILLSAKPLLSYLIWTFAALNYFTSEVSNFLLTFSLVFYFHSLLTNSGASHNLTTLWYLIISCNWSWTLITQLRVTKLLYLEHWLIFFFTMLNWSILFLDFSYWGVTSSANSFLFQKPLSVSQRKLLLFDTQLIEYSWEDYTLCEKYTENWLTLMNTNSTSVNTFALTLTHYTLWNVYHLSETYVFTKLYLELPLTPYISAITLIALVNYACLWFKS